MNLQPKANSGLSLAKTMKQAALDKIPFTDSEIDRLLKSIQNLNPPLITSTPSNANGDIDWKALRQFIATFAHESHKDWTKTEM